MAYPRCDVTSGFPFDEAGAPTAALNYWAMVASRRSAQASPNGSSTCSKCGEARSRSARPYVFPGPFTREIKCASRHALRLHAEEYDSKSSGSCNFWKRAVDRSCLLLMKSVRSQRGNWNFERAAALQTNKYKSSKESVAREPDFTRRIQDLDAVILQRAAEEQTIGVYGSWPAEDWQSRFSCDSARLPARPGLREQSFRTF